jgi:uncharacterized protein (DUF1778 family)
LSKKAGSAGSRRNLRCPLSKKNRIAKFLQAL